MYQTRIEIEEGLASAIIDGDSYHEIANILSEKNFSNKVCRQIFLAAKSLYPTRSIDLITLKIELESLFKDDSRDAISFFFTKRKIVYGRNMIPHWCFIILQMDIKNAFKDELAKWKDETIENDSLVESAVIDEIYQNITEDVDILDLVQKALLYFEHHKMSSILNKAQEFEENVIKKALQIKKNVSLDIALANVFRIAETSEEVKYQCGKFAKAIAEMTITNKVNNNYRIAADLL